MTIDPVTLGGGITASVVGVVGLMRARHLVRSGPRGSRSGLLHLVETYLKGSWGLT